MRLQKQSGKSTILSAAPILVRPVAIVAGLLSSRLRLDKTTGQQASTNRTSKDEHAHARTTLDEHTLGPDDAFATVQAGKEARRTRQRAVVRARAWTSPGRMAGLPFVVGLSSALPSYIYNLQSCTTKGAKKVAPQRARCYYTILCPWTLRHSPP